MNRIIALISVAAVLGGCTDDRPTVGQPGESSQDETSQGDTGRQPTGGFSGYGFLPEVFDPQSDPFVGDGEKVSSEEAQARTSYDLPIPVTNEVTGDLVAIWIEPNLQVAFVWETGLRMYADRDPVSEAASAAAWEEKVADEPGFPYVLTEINGHPAIGHDKDAKLPERLTDGKGVEALIDESAITLVIGSTGVSFISASHSLEELINLAEQLGMEGQ